MYIYIYIYARDYITGLYHGYKISTAIISGIIRTYKYIYLYIYGAVYLVFCFRTSTSETCPPGP